MKDMLLLRPPPRELLDGGPPQSIVSALQEFEVKRSASEAEAEEFALRIGTDVPP